MQNVVIRIATFRDRNSIEQVYSASAGTCLSLTQAEWTRWIKNNGLLVAEFDGYLVGFGGIDVNAEEQLKWLYLTPEFQGRGIGSKLLGELEEIGWRCGLKAIRLHSTPNSQSFYRRSGYSPVAIEAQFRHDHDGVEMIKTRR
jgi:GNAT superfamily N-acetyltransferase